MLFLSEPPTGVADADEPCQGDGGFSLRRLKAPAAPPPISPAPPAPCVRSLLPSSATIGSSTELAVSTRCFLQKRPPALVRDFAAPGRPSDIVVAGRGSLPCAVALCGRYALLGRVDAGLTVTPRLPARRPVVDGRNDDKLTRNPAVPGRTSIPSATAASTSSNSWLSKPTRALRTAKLTRVSSVCTSSMSMAACPLVSSPTGLSSKSLSCGTILATWVLYSGCRAIGFPSKATSSSRLHSPRISISFKSVMQFPSRSRTSRRSIPWTASRVVIWLNDT
mmetsp:Transcript_4979/g.13932  ORF Transcript_4979/g.13932 Transcript_4979/m.13932 type:complete len:279 (+) Transcript_4979:554-1390(+)